MIYEENFRSEEFYERKLKIALSQMAKALAEGKNFEISPSRSGIKMSTVHRSHVHLDRMSEYQKKTFIDVKGGVQSGS